MNGQLLSLTIVIPAVYCLVIHFTTFAQGRFKLPIAICIVTLADILMIMGVVQYWPASPMYQIGAFVFVVFYMKVIAGLCYWELLFPATMPRWFRQLNIDYTNLMLGSIVAIGWFCVLAEALR